MSSSADPILVSYQDSIVRLSNLRSLDDGHWLDDNIITFAFEYLQHSLTLSTQLQLVSPPVVQLLKMIDDSSAESIFQSMNFNEKKFLILPLNDNQQVNKFAGSHWSLLILSIRKRILYHFDSMQPVNDPTAKEIQRKFRHFFHENLPLLNISCPQQENGFDCGLYLISIAEEFYNELRSNEQLHDEKQFFEQFSKKLHRTLTPKFVDQRRKTLKTLLQTMSNNKTQ